MNKNILDTGVQEYIKNNWSNDIMSVLLKKALFEGVSNKEVVAQLESKKKCQYKLPSWFNTPNIYYPNKLNIEQTSSEITARYKASLLKGKSLIDLTGGLGIDDFYFSKKIDVVTHCEMNEKLSEIAAHNFTVLGVKNIVTRAVNGIEYLEETKKKFDVIYIDPSRRDASQRKVFLLSDCLPNVPQHLSFLFNRAAQIVIKTSPILDFSNGIQELKFVQEIHVVAVENEVKELLWILKQNFKGETLIKTINLKKNKNEIFNFQLREEKEVSANFSEPLAYLYEPNAAILKSGAFKLMTHKLPVQKLQEHTHLYTSNNLIAFPGRFFKVLSVILYTKKSMKSLALKKANISTRNFPETVATIRKKLKITDGGNDYLFFCKNLAGKTIVIHCIKTSEEPKVKTA